MQEHPGSKGQASQDGEGEQTPLHSNQLDHKKEDSKPKADVGTQSSGHRVLKMEIQGQCQGEGCIAEAVALAPWLRDGRSREMWWMHGVSERDKMHSQVNHILGLLSQTGIESGLEMTWMEQIPRRVTNPD